jgi:hypothetical protein
VATDDRFNLIRLDNSAPAKQVAAGLPAESFIGGQSPRGADDVSLLISSVQLDGHDKRAGESMRGTGEGSSADDGSTVDVVLCRVGGWAELGKTPGFWLRF